MVFMFYYIWQLQTKCNLLYANSGNAFTTISFCVTFWQSLWCSKGHANGCIYTICSVSLKVFHWQQKIIQPIIIIIMIIIRRWGKSITNKQSRHSGNTLCCCNMQLQLWKVACQTVILRVWFCPSSKIQGKQNSLWTLCDLTSLQSWRPNSLYWTR